MEEEKNSSLKTVIIILLVVAVLGLGGYIVYDKVIRKDDSNKDNEIQEEIKNPEEEKKESTTKELTVKEKEDYKEKVNGEVLLPLTDWYNCSGSVQCELLPSKIETNKNYLTEDSKLYLAFRKSMSSSSYEDNASIDYPEGETGSGAVGFTDFKNAYIELFNEEVTADDINKHGVNGKNKVRIKNNKIYSGFPTGRDGGSPYIEPNKIHYDAITDSYQLIGDYCVSFENDTRKDSCNGQIVIEYKEHDDKKDIYYLTNIYFESKV